MAAEEFTIIMHMRSGHQVYCNGYSFIVYRPKLRTDFNPEAVTAELVTLIRERDSIATIMFAEILCIISVHIHPCKSKEAVMISMHIII